MILLIADVLTADEIVNVHEGLGRLHFVDGTATAGWHAKRVKNNLQSDLSDPGYAALNKAIIEAILRNPTFRAAAYPRAITPLLFSRYRDGMAYGTHVDDAIMYGLRSDISFTLFLTEPDAYDGGHLVMETTAGEQAFKPAAGHMILYPSTTLHRVEPVTRGERAAAVGWCHSHVRHAAQREILYDLDSTRRAIFAKNGKSREFDMLSRTHANLLRMWADV